MKKMKNMFQTKSLRFQLLSRFFILFLSLLILLGITQYFTMSKSLFKSKNQLLVSRLRNIEKHRLEEIRTREDLVNSVPMLIKSMSGNNIIVTIIDNTGKIISAPAGEDGELSSPLLSEEGYKKIIGQSKVSDQYQLIKDDDGNEYMAVMAKTGSTDFSSGLIQLSTPTKDIREVLNRQLSYYIIISLMILIFGGIIGRQVLKHTLEPLNNMTNTMEQISIGELNTRLPVINNQLETDRLSEAFNEMLQRIETSFEKEQIIKEKLRHFISDASHELRTPLTSIRGFVEVLLRGAAKNEKQLNMALNSILTESERLSKLVNDLLTLTRLDQKASIEMKAENLSSIIKEIYPQLQMLGMERKINLYLDDEVIVYGNKDQLKQIVFNLVHNAVQHTDEKNGVIDISVDNLGKDKHEYAVLKISDNGTGIPKEHLNEIFDRFFRSESHRSRKHGGYGLGLSIVKSIVDAHKGEISVESIEGKGTEFKIFLLPYENRLKA